MATTSVKNTDRAFVDVDVCFDLLANRHPFYHAASQLFSLSNEGKVRLFVSSLTFAHLNYLLQQQLHNQRKVVGILSSFKILCDVLPVDDKVITAALASASPDFEDSIQYFSALNGNATHFITRNKEHYKKSALPVMTADAYLNL